MSDLIKVRPETKKRLDGIKHKGQSYDGVISELLNHREKKQRR